MPQSHLSILESSAQKYASYPAFQVPVLDSQTQNPRQWNTITYKQFQLDVETSARFWFNTFTRDNVLPGAIIGVWIGGFTYNDVVLIYSISRAGYIPQMISLRLPDPGVVFELLKKANAKALVFDPSLTKSMESCPVPPYPTCQTHTLVDMHEPLPSLSQDLSPDDTVFIFHTSGSTSGSPKVVPYTYRWFESAIEKAGKLMQPYNGHRQDVVSWIGSVCHVAQSFFFLGSFQHGTCTIQPTALPYSTEEFVDMIHRGKLNRLHQFPVPLAARLREARHDPKLLSLLSTLDEVLYTGLPLPQEEQDLAYRSGVRLRDVFGSTECGAMLLSVGDGSINAPLLRPIEDSSYAFVPVDPKEGHQSTARIHELVVLASSKDCPPASLRASDGNFHTGDLFQEANPGSNTWIYRGRDDDYIKTAVCLRCDTRAIEDNARLMCGDLISECIAVGTGRPSPTLFVESKSTIDPEKLKKEIIRKTRQFHARRYIHERITSTKFVVVVPAGSLPRTSTKGNIRRKAVEDAYKDLLDTIYSS